MEHWQILEIEATSELAKIKKAYAKKIKLCHPEDDPDGFQILRMAYETALEEAKYIDCGNSYFEKNVDEIVLFDNDNMIGNEEAERVLIIAENESIVETNLVDEFMFRVKELYNSKTLVDNEDEWRKLLEDDAYWALNVKELLSYRMLYFLQENYKKISFKRSSKVWEMLDKNFDWLEKQRSLYIQFEEEFVDFLIYKIQYSNESYWNYFIRIKKNFVLNIKRILVQKPILFRVVQVLGFLFYVFFLLTLLKFLPIVFYIFCIYEFYKFYKFLTS